ncbi:hypothetical protein LOTGIDRAFT_159725 [Lottia gigantea]|uniref:EGF-like calcium-binding domain-containing protein n=1 Tax=Lottia gigantea TaxID=225164 RepID=V4AIX1_LOTGI|nr:hypothetical protein LOTGIDRAFT_159725 [Lottia gigantea]ESO96977.1 hypothetical protein LOTGIDRAFT_159725 [Lottia gigantea]
MTRLFIGCDNYKIPLNFEWLSRVSCEDNKRYKCPEGYQDEVRTICTNGNWFLKPTCTDIDECATNNGLCEDKCQNQPGSYNCSCPVGSELQENGLCCGPPPGTVATVSFFLEFYRCTLQVQKEETQLGYSVNIKTMHTGAENKLECEEKYNNTINCTAWSVINRVCRLFGSPVILLEKNPDMTLEKCKEFCVQKKKYASAEWYIYYARCALFDSKQTEFHDYGGDDEAKTLVFTKVDVNCV